VDLVFRLLHQFSDQFSSLEKLVLAFHKNVCLSLCALLRRIIDDPVAVYDLLEVVLCATAVICLASSHVNRAVRGSVPLSCFFRPKEEGLPFREFHWGQGIPGQRGIKKDTI
jgi:hypothetical protein